MSVWIWVGVDLGVILIRDRCRPGSGSRNSCWLGGRVNNALHLIGRGSNGDTRCLTVLPIPRYKLLRGLPGQGSALNQVARIDLGLLQLTLISVISVYPTAMQSIDVLVGILWLMMTMTNVNPKAARCVLDSP